MNYKLLYQLLLEDNEKLRMENSVQKSHILMLQKRIEIKEKDYEKLVLENVELQHEAICNNTVATKLENILGNIITPKKEFKHIYG